MADATNTGRHYVAPWIAASLADLVGLGLLIGVQEPWTLAAAGGCHAAALLPIAFLRRLSGSEKSLALSFVFAMPIFGALMAVLALEHGDGDGNLISDLALAPPLASEAVAGDFGRLAAALPSCEALSAGTVEERRAIIATLVRRADADAVALLRWALGASDPDLAVDAALALEELTASFDARLAACRDALAAARSADVGAAGTAAAVPATAPPESGAMTAGLAASEAALAAAELITHAIDVGVADPALVPALAQRGARGLRAGRRGQATSRTWSPSGARSWSWARCAPTRRSPASTPRCRPPAPTPARS